ncbi:metallophosphoesterase [Streptomyces sp. NBC_00212]|uniref:metallophosphoesterase n=1 Tax=Streptomyces sp. NBC_00212 TaxID=2975684 RepID=UPI00324DB9CC
MPDGNLLAVSDLHVVHAENRTLVDSLRPASDGDWLIVAGDIGEKFDDVAWALRLLAGRFAKVIWTPGNHELWTHPQDPCTLRGEARYGHLVALCRDLGIATPELRMAQHLRRPTDQGPVVDQDGPQRGVEHRQTPLALRDALPAPCRAAGVWVGVEEVLVGADDARVVRDAKRLGRRGGTGRAERVVVEGEERGHRHRSVGALPDRVGILAQWCGTELTADWHLRFRAAAVIYGHLHIPRVTHYDGVCFKEVSVGYPREWRVRPPRIPLRRVLPAPVAGGVR